MSEVIASCGAGVMPQTAQVRPLTDAVADICGTLEHVVPPALAAAARLRRCVTHEAAIRPPPGLTAGSAEDADEGVKQKQKQKATTSGKGGNGVASDDKVAALVSECFGAVERLNAAGRIAGEALRLCRSATEARLERVTLGDGARLRLEIARRRRRLASAFLRAASFEVHSKRFIRGARLHGARLRRSSRGRCGRCGRRRDGNFLLKLQPDGRQLARVKDVRGSESNCERFA